MAATKKTQAECDEIRRKIFQATTTIIVEEGYENLSIRKIADRIKFSPSVIYHYFRDKNDIMTQVIASTQSGIIQSLLALPIQEMEPSVAMSKLLKEFASTLLANPQQFRATMLSGVDMPVFKDSKKTGVSNEETLSILVEVIEKAIQSGVFAACDGRRTAMLLVTAIYGLVNRLVCDKITADDGCSSIVDQYVNLLLNGLKK